MIGYDGPVLAFVEVKTRSAREGQGASDQDKGRNLTRMARQILRARRIESAACRFGVVAIDNHKGSRPEVHLYKGAFGAMPN